MGWEKARERANRGHSPAQPYSALLMMSHIHAHNYPTDLAVPGVQDGSQRAGRTVISNANAIPSKIPGKLVRNPAVRSDLQFVAVVLESLACLPLGFGCRPLPGLSSRDGAAWA